MFHKKPTIYIGYDPTEEIYCEVLKKSMVWLIHLIVSPSLQNLALHDF